MEQLLCDLYNHTNLLERVATFKSYFLGNPHFQVCGRMSLIIKETQNILGIKKYVNLAKERGDKLIIITEEITKVVPTILFNYYSFRKDIYFYRPSIWDNEYPVDKKRLKEIKKLLNQTIFEQNDTIVCVYQFNPRFTVTEGVKYTVISTGKTSEGYDSVEVITDSGFYGTYLKDCFEIQIKGDSTKETPEAPILRRLRR